MDTKDLWLPLFADPPPKQEVNWNNITGQVPYQRFLAYDLIIYHVKVHYLLFYFVADWLSLTNFFDDFLDPVPVIMVPRLATGLSWFPQKDAEKSYSNGMMCPNLTAEGLNILDFHHSKQAKCHQKPSSIRVQPKS